MTDVIPIEGKRKRDHRDIHEDLDTKLSDINQIPTEEFLATQTFDSLADTVPLDEMPDNDEMAQRGMSEGIWMRTCAVILQDDDKQLFEKFKDDQAADFWLDWMENLAGFIESQKAGLEILESCHMRLLVCASRYAKENFPETDPKH